MVSQSVSELIRVTSHPDGSFSAKAGGLCDLCAVGATRVEALAQLRHLLQEQLASGELAVMEVVSGGQLTPNRRAFAGHAKDDPDFDLYLEEIRRYREQIDQSSCSNTSSTWLEDMRRN